jgi:hypothetical protein
MSASNSTNSFPVQHFGASPVSDVLKTGEFNILWMDKDDQWKKMYSNFNENFKLFLTKMQAGNVKKYVEFVFNKGLIFFGVSKGKNPVFSRLLLSKNNRIAGIVLDSQDLDINLQTGETPSIDDCIYASYYSLIRSGVLLNKDEIQKDKELHKNLAIYLNQIFLRSLGKGTIYNEKQKNAILITCIYIYHRHFLQQKHLSALSFLKRNYSGIINKETLDNVYPLLESTSKYGSVQDIPKILIDLKIITSNPNIITMNLLKNLGISGFYNLIGSLDVYIGFVVLSRYPTGLFPRTSLISDKLHKNVEDIMIKYLNKVEYDVKALKRDY